MRILKRIFRISLWLLAGLVLVACALHVANSGPGTVPAKTGGALRVATYNVHYIWLGRETGAWSVGDWERRKAPMRAALSAMDADIIGFQEMESFARGSSGTTNLTLDYLLAELPEFRAAAQGDPAVFPSTQPIFYRAGRLRLLDQGWFFFSDTPEVIYSRTFNGSFPAFASWAAFETEAGARFRVYNVHFEYSSRSNQRLSAELVASRIKPLIAAGETVIVLGDLNTFAEGESWEILSAAGITFVPVDGATYHFNRGINLFPAIDHIGATADVTPRGAPVVLRQKFEGEWPTDHYPVFVDVAIDPR